MNRRKLFILSALLFLSLSYLKAQDYDVILHGGWNSSHFVHDGKHEPPGNGFYLGAGLEIPLYEGLRLQPQVDYFFSQSPNLIEIPGIDNLPESSPRLQMNELGLRIVLKYYLLPWFNLKCGPYAGIILNAQSYDGEDHKDITDELTLTQGGVSFGGEFVLLKKAYFQVSYDLGLSGLSQKKVTDTTHGKLLMGIGFKL